jgi:hypothetical protein
MVMTLNSREHWTAPTANLLKALNVKDISQCRAFKDAKLLDGVRPFVTVGQVISINNS